MKVFLKYFSYSWYNILFHKGLFNYKQNSNNMNLVNYANKV